MATRVGSMGNMSYASPRHASSQISTIDPGVDDCTLAYILFEQVCEALVKLYSSCL
jgi:hypothetical protein